MEQFDNVHDFPIYYFMDDRYPDETEMETYGLPKSQTNVSDISFNGGSFHIDTSDMNVT